MKVFVAILAFSFWSSLSQARSLNEVLASKTLKMATEGTFRPFSFFEGKKLTGFEVELGELIAAHLKLKPEWLTLPFDSLLIGVEQDRYDLVIASHSVTAERAKAVEFTSPHYCSGAVILSRKGGPKNKADLVGKIASAQVGTIYLAALKRIPGIKDIKSFNKNTDSLQALLTSKVDATIVDQFAALEMVHKNPNKLQLGEVLVPEHLAIALKKGNLMLRDAVNKALKEIQGNGEYETLSLRYFGRDVRCRDRS